MTRGERFILIIILILAAALRLYRLDHASLWDDTARTFLVCSAHDAHGVIELIPRYLPANPPLDPLLRHGFMRCTTFNTWCFTFPSVIFSVAGIFCVFLLARRLFDVSIALIATFLLTIHPFDLHFGQEGRNYAILNITVPLATLFFLQARRTNGLRGWALYSVALALCFYAHLVTAGVAVAHGLLALGFALHERWQRVAWTTTARWLSCYAAAAGFALLLFSPWLHYVFQSQLAARGHEWGAGQCCHNPRAVLETFLGHRLNNLMGCFVIFPIVGLIGTWPRRQTFLVIATISSVAYAVSYFTTISCFFHVRYVFFLLPFFLMVCAVGVNQAAIAVSDRLQTRECLPVGLRWRPTLMLGVLLAIVVVTNAPNLVAEYTGGAAFDGDWKPAVRYIDSNFCDGDTFLIPGNYQPRVAAYTGLPLDGVTLLEGKDRLLMADNEQVLALTGKHWASVAATPVALQRWLEQSGRTARWWVLCADPARCAEDDHFLGHFDAHAERLAVKSFKGLTVYLYRSR